MGQKALKTLGSLLASLQIGGAYKLLQFILKNTEHIQFKISFRLIWMKTCDEIHRKKNLKKLFFGEKNTGAKNYSCLLESSGSSSSILASLKSISSPSDTWTVVVLFSFSESCWWNCFFAFLQQPKTDFESLLQKSSFRQLSCVSDPDA